MLSVHRTCTPRPWVRCMEGAERGLARLTPCLWLLVCLPRVGVMTEDEDGAPAIPQMPACALEVRQGLPRCLNDEEPPCQCRRPGFDPWVGKIPWRRKRQLTPVFLPGESHGQRSLVGCSPWGRKESDTTKQQQGLPRRQLHCTPEA